MTASLFAVVNPKAGNGRGRAIWERVAVRLRELGIAYEFELTQGTLTAESFTRQALHAGAETILAVGGDGTVNEAINGFFLDEVPIRSGSKLAVVPAGSSSDFAHGLAIPDGPQAVDLLHDG